MAGWCLHIVAPGPPAGLLTPACNGTCSWCAQSRVLTPGRPPQPLTETADSETYPRVSPDGSKVAFISERESEDDLDLWWMPVPPAAVAKPTPLGSRPAKPVTASVPSVGTDGRPLRSTRIARVRGNEAYPSWAPDNVRIAFYAVREGIGSVWVTAVEPPRAEGTEEPLPRAKPAAQPQLVSRKGGAPAWSPDGKTLLVSGLPDPQPVYNGNPLRNEVEAPPMFALNAAFQLWRVAAPLPVHETVGPSRPTSRRRRRHSPPCSIGCGTPCAASITRRHRRRRNGRACATSSGPRAAAAKTES